MIELVTGTPGSSKTLSVVYELSKFVKLWEKNPSELRPIYTAGITGLELPHFDLPVFPEGGKPGDLVPLTPRGKPNATLAVDWDSIPDGALVVIDECQNFFPPRGPGSKAPAYIRFMNEARHAGFDVICITQHPKLIDNAVRRLVGKHRHMRRLFGWNRSMCYQWDHCEDGLQGIRNAVATTFSFPKSIYKLYHSAEVHTKQSFKKPWWIWLPLIILPLAVWAVPKGLAVITSTMSGKGLPTSAAVSSSSPASLTSTFALPVPSLLSGSTVASVASPLVPPLAASLSVKYSGCIWTRDRCKCFDVSGFSVAVEKSACMDVVQTVGHGLPIFDRPPDDLERRFVLPDGGRVLSPVDAPIAAPRLDKLASSFAGNNL